MENKNNMLGGKSHPMLPHIILSKTLGKGNFAKVLLGFHTITQDMVAVKMINKTRIGTENSDKIVREITSMKLLNHPNIVRLLEYAESDEELLIVTEYISGGELYNHLLEKGRLKENHAREKYRQILSAVHYCHSRGVVHRDLKTENMMIDTHNNIKLVDFGFSNMFDGINKLNTYCGSPPYAAPELFLGHSYVGPEVDVWALGIILYVMLTANLPFYAKKIDDLKSIVLEGNFHLPQYMSSSAQHLIKSILITDSNNRTTLENIMNHPWVTRGFRNCPLLSYCFFPIKFNKRHEIDKIKALKLYTNDEIEYTFSIKQYNQIMGVYLLLDTDKYDSNLVNKPSSFDCSVSSRFPSQINTKFPPYQCFIGIIDRFKRLFSKSIHKTQLPSCEPHRTLPCSRGTFWLKRQSVKSVNFANPRENTYLIRHPQCNTFSTRIVFLFLNLYQRDNIPFVSLSKVSHKLEKKNSNAIPLKDCSNTKVRIDVNSIESNEKYFSHKENISSKKNINKNLRSSWKFRKSTIISQSPETMLNKIENILEQLNIFYTKNSEFSINCTYIYPSAGSIENLHFNLEIHRMIFRPGYFCIDFKHVNGCHQAYHDILIVIKQNYKL
ncbi:hypothetical protein HZS_4196 [Henneguya salminicola]|nr:hypothetical protein HZS_4196 [Henneguya salminicola]